MLPQSVQIADLQRASVVDLLRLPDYYVPVLTRDVLLEEGEAALERLEVLDKNALNTRLARSYLLELMDRARIVCDSAELSQPANARSMNYWGACC